MSGIVRYAPRHALDLLLTRGLGMVAIGFVFILPVALGERVGDMGEAALTRLFGEMLGTLGVFYTLLATYGLSGADRRHGFYRFLFAKPISPVRYYALSYALTTGVFLLGLLVTVGLWSVMVAPAWPQPYLAEAVASYILLSTLVLVFSPMTNGDWLIALIALGLASGLRSSYPKDESIIGGVLDVLLPPTHSGRLFPITGGVQWTPLLVQLGYALVLFGVALVVVRKLPMGSSQ